MTENILNNTTGASGSAGYSDHIQYRQLVYQAVFCKCCGTTIQSLHRHDYKKCGCENEAMVDGGLDYLRYGAIDMNLIESISVYDDEPFEKVRMYAFRCGYGKDGKGVLRMTRLFEMDEDYLKAILVHGCPEWQRNLVKKELQFKIKPKLN